MIPILAWLIGIVILYTIITYAVSNGIDSSKRVKKLESDLADIKEKINAMEKEK
jgi:hypothetical protein